MKITSYRFGLLIVMLLLHSVEMLAAAKPDVMEYGLGFSTFFGKSAGAASIVTDRHGDVYIAGTTKDPAFPATAGALSRTLQGSSDAFIAKFSPEGKLLFSTLIGGSKDESASLLHVDDQGNVYLTGSTFSPDFPITSGVFRSTYDVSLTNGNAFIAQLDPTGNHLVFSTFFMPCSAMQLDRQGNLLLAGSTSDAGFPVSSNAYGRSFKGNSDAFVCKLSSDGSRLLASTLFGGKGHDEGVCLAMDSRQNVYLAGCSGSSDLPVTTNAFKKRLNGTINGYFVKFDPDLTTLVYASFYGGSAAYNFVHAMKCSSQDQLILSGQTYSQDIPVTATAYQSALGGDADLYVSILDTTNMAIRYSTYFGGNLEELGLNGAQVGGLTQMGNDCVLLHGVTRSSNFPVTEHAWQTKSSVATKPFFSLINLTYSKAHQLIYSSYWQNEFALSADAKGNIYLFGESSATNYPVTPGAYQTNFPGAPAFVLTRLQPRALKASASFSPPNLLINWSGGMPPYVVQQSDDLGVQGWKDTVTNALPPVLVPSDQGAAFYRIQGH